MILLSDGENHMIVASFISTQYKHVSEGVMAHYWSIFVCDSRPPHFNSLARDANFQTIFTSPETRMIVLPEGENRMIVPSFVSTQYQRVTEGVGVIAHYWSNFACDSRPPHFNSLARDDPLRISSNTSV